MTRKISRFTLNDQRVDLVVCDLATLAHLITVATAFDGAPYTDGSATDAGLGVKFTFRCRNDAVRFMSVCEILSP